MARALELANRPSRSLLPNPRVGTVIVWQNRIVGEGFHEGPGKPHAEVLAILDAIRNGFKRFSEASLYVNLEPCVHEEKRTTPCVPLLLEKGFKEIFVAHKDPNPQVAGRGIQKLRRGGIKVHVGLERDAALFLNQPFLKNQIMRLPYVRLKMAMTFDGKMATDNGQSHWITGKESRQLVHQLRSQVQGILTGKGTIEKDDPLLNIRLSKESAQEKLPIVICGKPKALEKSRVWKFHGPQKVVAFPSTTKILKVLSHCYEDLGLGDLLVEAGPQLCSSLLEADLADEIHLFYGRGFLGGRGTYSLGRQWAAKSLEKSKTFKILDAGLIGDDLHIKGVCRVLRTD